jgi:hypothetical protein
VPRRHRQDRRQWTLIDDLDLKLGILRPSWSEDEFVAAAEEAWQRRGARIVETERRVRPGHRPWAWWVFDADEIMPALDDEPARLAQRGDLDDEEITAVIERGARVVEDQVAGRIAAMDVPSYVRCANGLLEALGKEPLDVKPFGMYGGG